MLSLQTKRILFFLLSVSLLLALFFELFSPLLTPIGISFFLCFLLSPLVSKLEAYKVSRGISSFFLILFTLTLMTLVAIKALPYLYQELRYLVSMIPKALNVISETWIPALREFLVSTRLLDNASFEKLISEFGDLSQISTKAYTTLNTLWQTIPKLLGTVVNLVLIPMISFFIMVNLPRLKKSSLTLVPQDLREPTVKILTKINRTIRSLLRGQALVALIVGLLYLIAFQIIGLKSGFIIAIITGFGRLIPYVDIFLGGTLSLIVVFSNFTAWTDLVPVLLAFLIVGSLDGMLIAPRILGKQAGLHPLAVILSLLAFANLYGFWGFVLAVPAIAVFKDLVLFLLPYYYRSDFYKKNSKP